MLHQHDARRFSFPNGPVILIRKAKDVAFCEPTLPFRRMDEELLANWKSNPRMLVQWNEAFLAYRRCLESLPDDSEENVTARMLSMKLQFHRQAQDVRTPARVLFEDRGSESGSFENVASVPDLSPFQPSLDVSLPGLTGRADKVLVKSVRRT